MGILSWKGKGFHTQDLYHCCTVLQQTPKSRNVPERRCSSLVPAWCGRQGRVQVRLLACSWRDLIDLKASLANPVNMWRDCVCMSDTKVDLFFMWSCRCLWDAKGRSVLWRQGLEGMSSSSGWVPHFAGMWMLHVPGPHYWGSRMCDQLLSPSMSPAFDPAISSVLPAPDRGCLLCPAQCSTSSFWLRPLPEPSYGSSFLILVLCW